MKTFNEWLNENKLDDLLKDKEFTDRLNQDKNIDIRPRWRNDYRTTSSDQLSSNQKRIAAQYAGLPTVAKDDKGSQLTNDFDKLRHYLSSTWGGKFGSYFGPSWESLIDELKKIRRKKMFPSLFPSKKDIFAGFSSKQIESLKSLVGGLQPQKPSKLRSKLYSSMTKAKWRKAAEKIPFSTRLEIVVAIDRGQHDWWQQPSWTKEDLDPNSENYSKIVAMYKKQGWLGDDMKELEGYSPEQLEDILKDPDRIYD